jgi:hypothetical protein
LREGDETYWRANDVIIKLWKNMADKKINCHYLSPFTCYDLLSSKYRRGAFIAQALDFELKNFAQLQDMDACVKKIFFADYWNNVRP